MENKINKNQILTRLSQGIETMKKLTTDLADEHFHAYPIQGKWNMNENICHLVDFEIINLDRFKRSIAENNPLILNANETDYAQNLFYNKRSFANEIMLFTSARHQVMEIVSFANESDFFKTCVHNEAGKMTALMWLDRICGHAEHHFVFMDEKRIQFGLPSIGCKKPIDFPPA